MTNYIRGSGDLWTLQGSRYGIPTNKLPGVPCRGGGDDDGGGLGRMGRKEGAEGDALNEGLQLDEQPKDRVCDLFRKLRCTLWVLPRPKRVNRVQQG